MTTVNPIVQFLISRISSVSLGALLCLSVLLPPPAAGIDTLQVTSPDPILEPWRWTLFDKSNGPPGQTNDLYEDRDGNIWVTTMTGAHRYDGYRWTTHMPDAGAILTGMMQSHDGAMWFGSLRKGVFRFDPSSATWIRYTTADGLATNNVLWRGLIQGSDGVIWAGCWSSNFDPSQGTLGGISRFDGQTWTTVDIPLGPSRPSVLDTHEAADGSIWFSTPEHGLLRLYRGAWMRYTKSNGLASNITGKLLETRDGDIWCAFTDRSAIGRFNGTTWHIYTEKDGLPEGFSFGQLWQTRNGDVWAGVIHSGGLVRFDGQRWFSYPQNAMPYPSGAELGGTSVSDGSAWLLQGGENRFYRFNLEPNWIYYSHPDTLQGGFELDDGSVWFHTRRQAVRFENNTWIGYGPEDGFLDGRVTSMYQTSDRALWFLGRHKGQAAAARYDGYAWQVYTEDDGVVDRFFLDAFVETRNGEIWMTGMHNGKAAAARFDGRTWRRFSEADGLIGYRIGEAFEASDGSLWFGTYKFFRGLTDEAHGIYRYDGKTWHHYTVDDGLSSNFVTGFGEWPAGTLWIGTTQGVSRANLSHFPGAPRFDNKTDFNVGTPKLANFVSTPEAMYFQFQPNRNAGIVRYDGKTWQVINSTNGLASDAITQIYRASDGVLYFVGRTGLTRFDGTNWVQVVRPYHLMFSSTGSVLSLKEMKDGSFWITRNAGGALHFTYQGAATPETDLEPSTDRVSSAGNIRLRWSGADLWSETPVENLLFQWRIDRGKWRAAGRRTDLTLTSLSSGDHVFEVRAQNSRANVDPTPAVHAFIVEAPWWRNPFVIGFAVCLIGLTGLQTSRVVRRDSRLHDANRALSHANRELNTLNENLHNANFALERANEEIQEATRLKSQFLATMSHELRTPMNAIIGFTRLVIRRADNLTERQLGNLHKVQQSADHLLNLINDILDLSKIEANRLDMKPEWFQVKSLILSCCSTVSPLVRDGVKLTCHIDDDLGEAHTDAARLRQVMINLLSNALKFTEEGEVEVNGKLQNENCKLLAPLVSSRLQNGSADDREGPVTCDLRPAADFLEISVSDTGIGIPEDQLETIFDEFRQVDGSSTRKVQGTGLGLSICRKLTELMGGTIGVESEVGKGSTFTVWIPSVYREC